MSTELIEKLAQDSGPHSAYIEDSELRDMAIVWAVAIRNETCPVRYSQYLKRINEMLENEPLLYRRFADYLVDTVENGTHKAAWSAPAERIRRTLLPNE
jgi:hypothetical protein